jgi:hypothetical protein
MKRDGFSDKPARFSARAEDAQINKKVVTPGLIITNCAVPSTRMELEAGSEWSDSTARIRKKTGHRVLTAR